MRSCVDGRWSRGSRPRQQTGPRRLAISWPWARRHRRTTGFADEPRRAAGRRRRGAAAPDRARRADHAREPGPRAPSRPARRPRTPRKERLVKNETPNIDTAKLIHAIRELARVQRATAHVVARIIHRSPECDELAR